MTKFLECLPIDLFIANEIFYRGPRPKVKGVSETSRRRGAAPESDTKFSALPILHHLLILLSVFTSEVKIYYT